MITGVLDLDLDSVNRDWLRGLRRGSWGPLGAARSPEPLMLFDAAFDESEHPRDKDGKFAPKGGVVAAGVRAGMPIPAGFNDGQEGLYSTERYFQKETLQRGLPPPPRSYTHREAFIREAWPPGVGPKLQDGIDYLRSLPQYGQPDAHEEALVWTATGSPYLHDIGDQQSCLGETIYPAAGVSMHYHPAAMGPSPQDIAVMLSQRLSASYVVTPEGVWSVTFDPKVTHPFGEGVLPQAYGTPEVQARLNAHLGLTSRAEGIVMQKKGVQSFDDFLALSGDKLFQETLRGIRTDLYREIERVTGGDLVVSYQPHKASHLELYPPTMLFDAAYDESEHPRDKDGRFATKGGAAGVRVGMPLPRGFDSSGQARELNPAQKAAQQRWLEGSSRPQPGQSFSEPREGYIRQSWPPGVGHSLQDGIDYLRTLPLAGEANDHEELLVWSSDGRPLLHDIGDAESCGGGLGHLEGGIITMHNHSINAGPSSSDLLFMGEDREQAMYVVTQDGVWTAVVHDDEQLLLYGQALRNTLWRYSNREEEVWYGKNVFDEVPNEIAVPKAVKIRRRMYREVEEVTHGAISIHFQPHAKSALELYPPAVLFDAAFDEAEHPREKDGKFAPKGGGGSAAGKKDIGSGSGQNPFPASRLQHGKVLTGTPEGTGGNVWSRQGMPVPDGFTNGNRERLTPDQREMQSEWLSGHQIPNHPIDYAHHYRNRTEYYREAWPPDLGPSLESGIDYLRRLPIHGEDGYHEELLVWSPDGKPMLHDIGDQTSCGGGLFGAEYRGVSMHNHPVPLGPSPGDFESMISSGENAMYVVTTDGVWSAHLTGGRLSPSHLAALDDINYDATGHETELVHRYGGVGPWDTSLFMSSPSAVSRMVEMRLQMYSQMEKATEGNLKIYFQPHRRVALELYAPVLMFDAAFDESEHPREHDGKFAPKGGGGTPVRVSQVAESLQKETHTSILRPRSGWLTSSAHPTRELLLPRTLSEVGGKGLPYEAIAGDIVHAMGDQLVNSGGRIVTVNEGAAVNVYTEYDDNPADVAAGFRDIYDKLAAQMYQGEGLKGVEQLRERYAADLAQYGPESGNTSPEALAWQERRAALLPVLPPTFTKEQLEYAVSNPDSPEALEVQTQIEAFVDDMAKESTELAARVLTDPNSRLNRDILAYAVANDMDPDQARKDFVTGARQFYADAHDDAVALTKELPGMTLRVAASCLAELSSQATWEKNRDMAQQVVRLVRDDVTVNFEDVIRSRIAYHTTKSPAFMRQFGDQFAALEGRELEDFIAQHVGPGDRRLLEFLQENRSATLPISRFAGMAKADDTVPFEKVMDAWASDNSNGQFRKLSQAKGVVGNAFGYVTGVRHPGELEGMKRGSFANDIIAGGHPTAESNEYWTADTWEARLLFGNSNADKTLGFDVSNVSAGTRGTGLYHMAHEAGLRSMAIWNARPELVAITGTFEVPSDFQAVRWPLSMARSEEEDQLALHGNKSQNSWPDPYLKGNIERGIEIRTNQPRGSVKLRGVEKLKRGKGKA